MKTNFKHLRAIIVLVFFSLFISLSATHGQNFSSKIRLNQIGYYPEAPKKAVVASENAGESFFIVTPSFSDTLYSGRLKGPYQYELSGETTFVADFSDFHKKGTFLLWVPTTGYSHQFEVGEQIHRPLADAALKSYYYIRASTKLPYAYAGLWSRPAGPKDDQVLIHPSAASPQRPEGTVISSSKGWYDAGDYNKYIVNSGITTATMLSLYEDFPAFGKSISLDIPSKDNRIPDLLDEILWNLRWMMTMQDPNDGGVYHKMTFPGFQGMVMPAELNAQRYVVQKSTAAALDFAAVMSQASRIFSNYEDELPGLADSCLTMAKKAWQWADENPNVIYDQQKLNEEYDPDITTGAYGGRQLSDEFIWAATELYASTGDEMYLDEINLLPDKRMPLPSWGQVRLLGYYTLLRFEEKLGSELRSTINTIKSRLTDRADDLIHKAGNHPYRTIMGKSASDFGWGSNSGAANQAILVIQAYLVTNDNKYLNHALSNLDYLAGRNATGYSFITGHGDHTPMHIHHRPSEADGVREPVPGLLAGGPNPDQQDNCEYPSDLPAKSYVDVMASYASNETCINWNAPLVYLTYALEKLQYEAGFSN